jgi:hypothetical protein
MFELDNADTTPLTPESNNSGATGTTLTTVPSPTWPIETDVIYVDGTNRIKLSVQSTLLRSIFHTAFENVRCSLVFEHAFPVAVVIPCILRKAVVAAAEAHRYANGRYNSSAACVHQRLLSDVDYEAKMIRLVSIYYIENDMTKRQFSRGHGLPSSEAKSKSVVPNSSRSNIYLSKRKAVLSIMSTSNLEIIYIHVQRLQL